MGLFCGAEGVVAVVGVDAEDKKAREEAAAAVEIGMEVVVGMFVAVVVD